jgi:hypothetical protein
MVGAGVAEPPVRPRGQAGEPRADDHPGSLREQRERVTELAFAQFYACRWGVSEAQWLPPGAWSACRDDFEVEDGEPPIAGIDIGGSRAASALVAVTEDLRVAHVEVFQGERSVLAITEALIRLAERHPITEAAYDPLEIPAKRCAWSATTAS